MSLINQALRKAQRDRSPDRATDAQSVAPAPVASGASKSGMKLGLVLGLAVTLAVLVGLVVGLSIVLIKDSGATAKTEQIAAGSETVETKQASTQIATAEALKTEEPRAILSANTPAEDVPSKQTQVSSVVEELRLAREAAEAKAAAEAKIAAEAVARAAAKPSPAIIDWLSKAQMSGVKISGADSKVILNGKPYSVGDYANYALGLKVMIIQEKRVLFVDKNGKKYLKKL